MQQMDESCLGQASKKKFNKEKTIFDESCLDCDEFVWKWYIEKDPENK